MILAWELYCTTLERWGCTILYNNFTTFAFDHSHGRTVQVPQCLLHAVGRSNRRGTYAASLYGGMVQ